MAKETKTYVLIGTESEKEGFLTVLEKMEIPVKEIRELTPCELMSLGIPPIQFQPVYGIFFDTTDKRFNKVVKKSKKTVEGCRRIF